MSGLYPSPPDPLSPKRGEGEKTRWQDFIPRLVLSVRGDGNNGHGLK